MAASLLENRAYFTIAGKKYQLAGLVKDITFNTGTIAKGVQAMTPDQMMAGIIKTNYTPTIQWTEVIPQAPSYVKLLQALSVNSGVPIVIQPFIIGDNVPSGLATLFTNCQIAAQDTSYPAQDIEGTRRINIVAVGYYELT